MKRALVTGISGQDASYLAELLLERGYEVHGITRRIGVENQECRYSRINHILPKLHLHQATLENYGSLFKIVEKVKPDEIYHLAAQSYVGNSFDDELSTMQINATGTHYMLNAVKEVVPNSKFYFAGSSEMFGKVEEIPQTETTRFHPRSSYGISKVAGYELTRHYREAFGMFACSGILFNHESPRRGFEFVTRKITRAVANIYWGHQDKLYLGNLDAKRDWGYTKDFVEVMWRILQQPEPEDFVVGTGETHSVREFCDLAFDFVGLNYNNFVVVDPVLYRPADVELLLADPTKAKQKLNFEFKTTFKDLVRIMLEHDLEEIKEKVYAGRSVNSL